MLHYGLIILKALDEDATLVQKAHRVFSDVNNRGQADTAMRYALLALRRSHMSYTKRYFHTMLMLLRDQRDRFERREARIWGAAQLLKAGKRVEGGPCAKL